MTAPAPPRYTMWVARDANGALRIYDQEPQWGETMWLRPTVTTWLRKLPPRWFPDLKPGAKLRCSLAEARQ